MEAQNRKRKPTIFLFGILGRFMLVSKLRPLTLCIKSGNFTEPIYIYIFFLKVKDCEAKAPQQLYCIFTKRKTYVQNLPPTIIYQHLQQAAYPGFKGLYMLRLNPMLKHRDIMNKVSLPAVKSRPHILKNPSISLLPDMPAS